MESLAASVRRWVRLLASTALRLVAGGTGDAGAVVLVMVLAR